MNKIPTRDAINNARLQRLKKTLQSLFTSLCRYNHGTKANDSTASLGGPQTGFSIDSFYVYLATVDLLLSQLIYLYVLTDPMILFPVEPTKKWGVEGPVGMYADAHNYKIVRAYLGKNNVQTLKKNLSQLESVKNLLDYFDAQPDLTEAEQEQSWIDFIGKIQANDKPTAWPARIAMNKSYYRSLRWSIHYERPPSFDDEIDHDQVEGMFETAKSW